MDLVIIGGGKSGRALAAQCMKEGLQAVVVDQSSSTPRTNSPGEWVQGKGVVSKSALVAVLDPQTGDERRLLSAKAIVLAVGKLDPADLPAMTLGITKLGVQLSDGDASIVCNSRGETRARGVYATGSCASVPTPEILHALVEFCAKSASER